MAHVKIYPPESVSPSKPRAAFGTRVVVVLDNGDEHELSGVAFVRCDFAPDDVAKAKLEIIEYEFDGLPEEVKAVLQEVVIKKGNNEEQRS